MCCVLTVLIYCIFGDTQWDGPFQKKKEGLIQVQVAPGKEPGYRFGYGATLRAGRSRFESRRG